MDILVMARNIGEKLLVLFVGWGLFTIFAPIKRQDSMKKAFVAALVGLFALTSWAQEQFEGIYYSQELKTTLRMNLAEKNIPLKDLDFDETYGYMAGNLNGTWVILKVKKVEERKALVRMVSDMGNDAQDVELRLTESGDVELRLVSEQNIKAVQDRKYVKLPKVVVFKKKS